MMYSRFVERAAKVEKRAKVGSVNCIFGWRIPAVDQTGAMKPTIPDAMSLISAGNRFHKASNKSECRYVSNINPMLGVTIAGLEHMRNVVD